MAFLDRFLQSPAAFVPGPVPGGELVAVPTRHSVLRVFDSGPRDVEKTVILSPDTPCTIEHHLDALVPALLARGYRVISFDIPGSGFSTVRSSYGYSFDDLADVIADLASALLPPGRRAALAFTCASSFAALLAARRRPDLFSHVVVAQVPELAQSQAWVRRMDPSGTMAAAVWGQLALWWNKERIARGWFVSALPRGSGMLPDVTAKSVEMLRKGGSYCLASMFQSIVAADVAALEPRLVTPQPAGLMWGKRDRTHSKSDGASAKKYLPNLVAHEEVECAHFPDIELPSRFADMVDRVMQTPPTAGAESKL
ncbi:Alpha/Beta hydrolase protein [Hyaloraphidium curvatum]|nr:Alpha/Beta hydrolase protein [Hyaloraphidium curvatum]